ncbi:BT_3928 family protein [Salegentibacter sp.]|uniref:BT_3928 family protein n=1 Tax=Salegentibacter sp. TaxID=1903072 RepID=UPI003565B654
MKLLVGIARVLVGVLFIFSGFIKLNDPVGFSFKLQEYFGENVLNLEFLIPYALVIAIILVVFELVLGIMLLIGYLPKFTMWSLLLMILFFTFLTFYSAYFNKVTDCGCFGDAIPLTPWQSFYKDVILLVLIIFLFVKIKFITPVFAPVSHRWIIFLFFMLSFMFAYYVLMHLPVFDFRAYKVGNNIKEQMEIPEGAPKAVFEYKWKFEQDGEEIIITNTGEYPQVDGEFIDVETEQISEGYVPPVTDFQIEDDGEDITDEILIEEKVFLIVAYDLRKTERDGYKAVKELSEEALSKGYRVVGLTASGEEERRELIERYDLNFDFYQTDETALKAIVRSNPGLLTLKRGTITQKKHWYDADDIRL